MSAADLASSALRRRALLQEDVSAAVDIAEDGCAALEEGAAIAAELVAAMELMETQVTPRSQTQEAAR